MQKRLKKMICDDDVYDDAFGIKEGEIIINLGQIILK